MNNLKKMSGEKNHSIRKHILSAIHSGKLAMRPKWHFVLKISLVVAGAAFIFLAALYLLSFILFSLRVNGIWYVTAFGSRGWFEFFRSLPWLLLIAAFAFIVILEILFHRFSFSHRQPLLYSVSGIIIFVFAGAALMLPMQREFSRMSNRRNFPLVGKFYHGSGPPRNTKIHIGVISTTTDFGFIIENPRHEILEILTGPETRYPFGLDPRTGAFVVVFGNRVSSTVKAFGVRTAEEDVEPFFMRMPPRSIPPHFMNRKFR